LFISVQNRSSVLHRLKPFSERTHYGGEVVKCLFQPGDASTQLSGVSFEDIHTPSDVCVVVICHVLTLAFARAAASTRLALRLYETARDLMESLTLYMT